MDSFESDGLIDCKTIDAAQGRVTTPKDMTSHDTNSFTPATNHDDYVSICELIEFRCLNTTINFQNGTDVKFGAVVRNVVNRFEMASPDAQCIFAGRSAKEVMANILDHETKIRIASEVHGKLNIRYATRIDNIVG